MDAALLVLVLQRGELAPPTADAMVAAARTVLGAAGRVELVESDVVDDALATREGTARHAAVVAEVRADGTHVHLRVLVVGEARWSERDLGFSDRDRPEERGRTLGFAVASMMPVIPDAPTEPPRPPIVPPPPPRAPEAPDPVPPSPRRWFGAIDAMGVGSLGLGGAGGGFGAMIAGTFQPRAPWSIRVAVSPRFGDIPEAQATTLTVVTALGVALQLGAQRPGTFGFGARLDLVAGFVRVTHFSADDPVPDHQSRWLPGFDAAIEGLIRVTPGFAVVLASGIEGFWGSTDVYVRGQPVATMSPLRLLGEVGIRARF